MGYITEPKGVDLVIAPSKLTVTDTAAIRSAINAYKQAHKSPAQKTKKAPKQNSIVAAATAK